MTESAPSKPASPSGDSSQVRTRRNTTQGEASDSELTSVVMYAPDQLSAKATLVAIAATILGSSICTLGLWYLLKVVKLPPFGGSQVTKAGATAGIFLTLLATCIFVLWWMTDDKRGTTRPRWRTWITYAVTHMAPAGLVMATIGVPLSPSRLYLEGITVDQGFRTQFLTRLTATQGLPDMNYADLPAYYPGAWFWLGARFAQIIGFPGWAIYQPWALLTIAVTGCVLVPVWQRLVGSLPVATAIALVTTAIALTLCAFEPYACVIAMGIPAALVMGRRALAGQKLATVGVVVYLGASASTYTLYTAVIALSLVTVAGLFFAFVIRSWKPIRQIIIIGVSSMAIASIVWGPYLWLRFTGHYEGAATASHFLPPEGTVVPLPMFATSFVGVLCLIGLIYLIMRVMDPDVCAMGVGLAVMYLWVIASMSVALSGTTLLGFRLDSVITIILGTAGVLGLAELRLVAVHRFYPVQFSTSLSTRINVICVVVLALAGIQYAQAIPDRNAHAIELAYTNTDGDGHRADFLPPDATQYYAEVDHVIQEKTGKPAANAVVLTDEFNFLTYYPYLGFQAFTSHYANPLGEFEKRNAVIENWASQSWDSLKDPQDFDRAVSNVPWRSPDAFVLRADSTGVSDSKDGWNFNLAIDIFPSNPNVWSKGVRFNPEVFQGENSPWTVTQVGPFVVVTHD